MSEKIKFSLTPVANVTRTRFIEKQVQGREWVSYGNKNDYPDHLWRQYLQCPTQMAIIDAKTAFTMGTGIDKHGNDVVNAVGDTLNEVMTKAVFDYHLFGGFALQIIYNKAGQPLELYWADFSKLRLNKSGKKIFWCDNWGGYQSQTKVIEYDAYNPRMTNKTTQIFYYRGASCRSVYPIPTYIACSDAIQTEIEIQNYHLNAIKNGFAVNAIINFNNGVPDEEERKEMERAINAKFSGSQNAARTMISWNENKETATTVERLETDNFDKKFQQLAKDTQEAIFVAHRITSGTLLGRLPANTGFTKNEYREAFEVFNQTVIMPYQREICATLRKIYPDKEFNINPFYISNE